MVSLTSLVGPVLLLALGAQAWLSDYEKQLFVARIYQSTLRGPRMRESVGRRAGLTSSWESRTDLVPRLRRCFHASCGRCDVDAQLHHAPVSLHPRSDTENSWDVRWWSIAAELTNGTKVFVPTVGYYPYSGNTGLSGVTGPAWDAGTYQIDPNTQSPNFASLNLNNVTKGSVVFYYNPPQTANNTEPQQTIVG